MFDLKFKKMGGIPFCCRRPDDIEETKSENNDYYIFTNKKNKKIKSETFLDINSIIISEDSNNSKKNNDYKNGIIDNNEINNNTSIEYDIEKIIKIQKKFRSYLIFNKFIKVMKPLIQRNTTNNSNKYNELCLLCGQMSTNKDDFSEDGWKRYYPSDERFFLYINRDVIPNQKRLKNINDPEKIEIYEGEINKDNIRQGSGVLTTPHNILMGSWRRGEFTGWGRNYYRNGDILEGKFINGEINGKGTLKNKDSIYIGEFINGEKYGKGDLTTEKYHYNGEFKNNKFDGFGIIEFLNEGHKYEGYFDKNEMSGKGIYKWKNGDIYEGEIKNGKMNGIGKYRYLDGKIYEGEYNNGIKNGKGKLSYPNGKTFEGNFKDGLPDGEGIYTDKGKSNKVLFSKGIFVKVLS